MHEPFYGKQIEETIGKVVDVDVEANDTGWGCYLQVRVKIPLTKSLARGRSIYVKWEKLWILFKYEKFPWVCFSCRIIRHGSSCSKQEGMQGAQ